MASAYPGGLDSFATNKSNATSTSNDHPTHHNDLADAVNKIEAELGITPSGASATVAARFGTLGAVQQLGPAIPGSVTFIIPGTDRRYASKFTTTGAGIAVGVGAYVRQVTANVWGLNQVAIFDNDSNEPGKLLGVGSGAESLNGILLNTTAQVARFLWSPVGAYIPAAGDYWAVWWAQDTGDITLGTDATAGSGTNVSGYSTEGGAWFAEKGATGHTWNATANANNIINVSFVGG